RSRHRQRTGQRCANGGIRSWNSMPDLAVVDGADVGMLRALAPAEALSERANLVIATRAEVYPRLVEPYSATATTNCATVGKEFDTTASKFSASGAMRCGSRQRFHYEAT